MISPQKGGRDRLCICATLFTGIYSDLANLSDMYDALSDIQLYEQTRTRYQLERVASPMRAHLQCLGKLSTGISETATAGVSEGPGIHIWGLQVWYFRLARSAIISSSCYSWHDQTPLLVSVTGRLALLADTETDHTCYPCASARRTSIEPRLPSPNGP